ncbi:MAG: flagellar protein FlaG [Bacillota bacterium]|uniref:flagellar protein FlaG n=1 Tax=Desulfurispora thermophila TaxID=265470 RepID=UPI00036FA864|nr:flagellar protein FlaG [Desulfurispora thermophila]
MRVEGWRALDGAVAGADGVWPGRNNSSRFVPEQAAGESVRQPVEKGKDGLENNQTAVFTPQHVQAAVEKLNKTMETYGTELRFVYHEKSGEYMVKVISEKDKSVIREIPPHQVLEMVAYFKEMLGIIVDKFI